MGNSKSIPEQSTSLFNSQTLEFTRRGFINIINEYINEYISCQQLGEYRPSIHKSTVDTYTRLNFEYTKVNCKDDIKIITKNVYTMLQNWNVYNQNKKLTGQNKGKLEVLLFNYKELNDIYYATSISALRVSVNKLQK